MLESGCFRPARQSFLFVFCVTVVFAVCPASADTRVPSWTPELFPVPGADGPVYASIVFDDGHGPALYIGGQFTVAGTAIASAIVRWDGQKWHDVGGGFTASTGTAVVYALAVFDDGSGPALYAGGSFEHAGGQPAQNIARWNGSKWETLVQGTDGPVLALAGFAHPGGSSLYVGGEFATAGGVTSAYFARWNGASWSDVGGVTDGVVRSLLAADGGTGPVLYAGGLFTQVGGIPASHIGRWDGSAWSQLGTGVAAPTYTATVNAMAAWNDGTGPALYVGGQFETAGDQPTGDVAKWDGQSWTPLGDTTAGVQGTVYALAAHNDGSGGALYVGGSISRAGGLVCSGIAKWTGAEWLLVGPGLDQSRLYNVRTLASVTTNQRTMLLAGGVFDQEYYAPPGQHLALWDGQVWSPCNPGLRAHPPEEYYPGGVMAMAAYDDGGGPSLHVGGAIRWLGPSPGEYTARWTGNDWVPIADDEFEFVGAMAGFDDGYGPALWIGGSLHDMGGATFGRIVRWDGTSAVRTTSDWPYHRIRHVRSLSVFELGGVPTLLAVGRFESTYGGSQFCSVAQWDGDSWTCYLDGPAGSYGHANAIAFHDDGTGPSVYVGGYFDQAGGVAVQNIARWDGVQWHDVGGGLDDAVADLAVFDDGSGPALYAAGEFDNAGRVPAAGVARWDGTQWSALGGGISVVYGGPLVSDLHVFDDGSGAALYVGGWFDTAGGITVNHIAAWDAEGWHALGDGVGGVQFPWVQSIFGRMERSGPALYVGGDFLTAGGVVSSHLARWGHQSDPGDWDADGDVDLVDYDAFSRCLNGPNQPPQAAPPVTAEECIRTFDADRQGDVDLADFAAFATAFAP